MLIHQPPPPPPTKKLHNRYFQFLLGITVGPREIEGNGYAKFSGANRVHYGLCENGELREENLIKYKNVLFSYK